MAGVKGRQDSLDGLVRLMNQGCTDDEIATIVAAGDNGITVADLVGIIRNQVFESTKK